MRLRKHSLLGFLVLGWVSTFMLVHVASSANLSPDLQRYVGTWQAQFKDTTFVVLRLREQNSKLGGTVVHATHVQADPKGELLAVDITNVEDKIVEAHATKDKLIVNIAESADQGNLSLKKTTAFSETGLRASGPDSWRNLAWFRGPFA